VCTISSGNSGNSLWPVLAEPILRIRSLTHKNIEDAMAEFSTANPREGKSEHLESLFSLNSWGGKAAPHITPAKPP
jgi:hypothetical protein